MTFDYQRLSPQDFEKLAADVLACRENATIEQFTEGRDGGIDLRYQTSEGSVVIAQAKRVRDFRQLESLIKKERPKLQRLNPSGYRLITSCPLTPQRKAKLQAALHPWAQRPAEIIGRDDLDATLREYPDLIRRHVKLWLQDGEQLQAVLHRAEESASRDAIDTLRERIHGFVCHRRVEEAAELLKKRHCCLITGAPGVGKTALAAYLALQRAADEGYEPLLVRDRELDSARRLLQEGRRQILILDDFLGAQFLDPERGLALEESLLGLIRKIQRGSGEHKLLMTTRDYILEQARQRLGRFHRDVDRLDRVILTIEDLDEWERARILVAQLDRAGTPADHIRGLVTSGTHRRLVTHRNFTPRLAAETAEDAQHQTATAYPDWLEAQFDDPVAYWEQAFRHLSPAAQHWLYVLAIAGGQAAVEDLTDSFHALHHELAAGRVQPNPMEDALKEIEPNFALAERIDDTLWLNYATPAIGDLLQRLIDRDEHLKARLVAHLRRFQHGLHLFQLAEGDSRPVRTDAALRAHLLEQHRVCLDRPALERKIALWRRPPRDRLVRPDTPELLIRLWRAWNGPRPGSTGQTAGTCEAEARNAKLAALADQYLADEAAWRDAFARQPYEPLLALAARLPDTAKRHAVWNAALEMIADTANARALAEAASGCQELRDYLKQEEKRFLKAISEVADNEVVGTDDSEQIADAIANLEAIETYSDLELFDARHALMDRLEELREQEPEEDNDMPCRDRGEDAAASGARLDALFWQLVEVAW